MKRHRNGRAAIEPWATGRLPSESGLVIGGRRVPMGKKQRRLLMQLHKEMGRVVPHGKMCSLVGNRGARDMVALRGAGGVDL
jgi:hypothetical protein